MISVCGHFPEKKHNKRHIYIDIYIYLTNHYKSTFYLHQDHEVYSRHWLLTISLRFPFPLEFDLWLSELVCVAINISYNLSILKWCASLVYTTFLQSKVLIAPLLCTWDRQFLFNNLCLSYVLSWSYFPVHPWVSRPADRDEPPSTPMNPWMSKVRFASWSCLVGGWPTTLNNMKVGWDDEIPNIWKIQKRSKPPTSCASDFSVLDMPELHSQTCFSWISFELQLSVWVCLKIGYIPNEIAIFHRDNDH